jgi:hypothetical protein
VDRKRGDNAATEGAERDEDPAAYRTSEPKPQIKPTIAQIISKKEKVVLAKYCEQYSAAPVYESQVFGTPKKPSHRCVSH